MEWIANNLVAIVVAVVTWLGTVAMLIWYLSGIVTSTRANGVRLEKLVEDFDRHEGDFDRHRLDGNVHTTFEQRQAFNARLDRMESSMSDGHNRIEAKIDRWAERLMNK